MVEKELNKWEAIIDETPKGKIRVLSMAERGAYPDSVIKGEEGKLPDLSSDLGMLTHIDRQILVFEHADGDERIKKEGLTKQLAVISSKEVIVFMDCLSLATTEIVLILRGLNDRGYLKTGKTFLVNLSQIEYLTLRDRLKGQIEI